jgi:hypothetical protein
MNMPGFAAEASLYGTSEFYQISTRNIFVEAEGTVRPARRGFPCSQCDQICEGDFIGACMPWCLCACRGGTHCGHPS